VSICEHHIIGRKADTAGIARLGPMSGAQPVVERPHAPYYGFPDSLDGALPWSWAVERLAGSRTYFLSTIRKDGSPHVMPLWAVWVHDSICLSTAYTTVKSRNLERDPRCVLTVESDHDHVVYEGRAELTQLDAIPDFTAIRGRSGA
jgi:PPOX class probable F420-dependent enzyme